MVTALFLSRQRVLGDVHRPAKARASAGGSGVLAQVRPLLVPPIMMAFGYFALVAASMSAVQIFAVSAMVTIYEVPLTLAAGALTVYMLGSAAGIVCGGFLADRMRRHGSGVGPGQRIEPSFETDAVLPAPQQPDDLDRLLER